MFFKNLIFLLTLLKLFITYEASEHMYQPHATEATFPNFDYESVDSLVLEQRSTYDFKNLRSQLKYISNNNKIIPKKEGEFCRRSFDGRGGYCTLAHKCLHVVREHRKNGVKVDFCLNNKNIPVICCPLEDKHLIKHRISATMCKKYHSAANDMPATTRKLTGNKCVSSVPMIVGGKPTNTGEYPHMAALGWTQQDQTIHWGCGGFLISEQFIVTAAHCATTNSKPMDMVRLGVLKLNETTARHKRDIKILLIIVPPNYNSSAYYDDIALIKLTRRINRFTDRIRPACLWQQATIPTNKVIATGWGRTKFNGAQSNDLMKVELNVFDQQTCIQFYQKERRLNHGIMDSQFCAGHLDGGKDTCQGDSGGPVHIEVFEYNCMKFVVGVTSFGKACAAQNSPGVYTKIYNYLDWIEEVVFKKVL